MSYPKNIVQVRPHRGANVDIPPSEVGPEFYTAAQNMHFRDGFAQRTNGEIQVYPNLLSNLRNIINMQDPGELNYWIYTGDSTVHAVIGSVHSNITPLATLTPRDDPNTYTTSLLNGLLIWNNGDDPPYFWDSVPANPMEELPGWISGDRCEAMRPFKFHLFALDMTEAVAGSLPMKLKWSSAAAPGNVPASWTPAADNDAGDTQLADTPSKIIDAMVLRGSFIIYKQHSTYICDYVGGNFVFSFRKLFVTSGVLSRNCITEYNGSHFVLTDDDIVRHDGNSITSLLDKRARRAVFGGLDEDNFQASFVANYEKKKEIWFCIPSSGNTFADTAVIYNLEEDAWSQRDLVEVAHANTGIINDSVPDDSWDADAQAWDLDLTEWEQQLQNSAQKNLVLASTNEATPTDSKLLEVDIGPTFDGLPVNGVLQKFEMHFDQPDRVKICKRVWPKFEANDGVVIDIRMGSSKVPGGSITWGSSVPFTQGTTEHIDLFAQGRYLSFEASQDGGLPWTLLGFDLEIEIRGYH